MNTTQIGWVLNMVGLLISVWGSFLLAKGTPRDTPDLPQSQISSVEMKMKLYEKSKEEIEKWQKRVEYSRKGFWLVLIGFVLQIISQVFQNPFGIKI